MNNNTTTLVIRKIVDDQTVSMIRYEKNSTVDMVMKTFLNNYDLNNGDFESYDSGKLNLHVSDDFNNVLNVETGSSENGAPTAIRLNFPTLIKCQNCETHFPTKYQYQRHQCDFNIEKVQLKQLSLDHESTINDITVKQVFECSTCLKYFANEATLKRHQLLHSNNGGNNICEFCDKHFVSENRLRIHKENHCKKAGDISKFYRSDITVWKCKKCNEVFSSPENADNHVALCQEVSNNLEISDSITDANKENTNQSDSNTDEDDNLDSSSIKNPPISKSNQVENQYIQKISTEILLQCEFCNRTFSDKNSLLMHQRKHTTSKNYECVNCDKVFDSYCAASSHWLKKCTEFANVFFLPRLSFCEYCDRTFKSHEILYNHKVKKKHYTPKLHIALNSESDVVDNLETKVSADNKNIINRLIQDVLKTLDVPLNNKSNGYKDGEGSNENISFNISNIKTEPESDKSSSSASVHHSENEIEPNKSGRKRKWHKTTPKSKKYCMTTDKGFKYQCERCVKVFNCIASLETHRTSEHIASFCCNECGQTLPSAKALLIHCRAHKSLKPYVCDTCGRSYSQTSHLWQHMRFHQGIKPFACPHAGCEARYTIRPDLKDHIRKVHTRERPFKCNVCNKCFLTGSVYYQHRLIHTNDRRYGCEICNKRFFRADALNNHKRIHTDERPYPCNVCGREFRQKGDRNKHVRTQHPDFLNSNI